MAEFIKGFFSCSIPPAFDCWILSWILFFFLFFWWTIIMGWIQKQENKIVWDMFINVVHVCIHTQSYNHLSAANPIQLLKLKWWQAIIIYHYFHPFALSMIFLWASIFFSNQSKETNKSKSCLLNSPAFLRIFLHFIMLFMSFKKYIYQIILFFFFISHYLLLFK